MCIIEIFAVESDVLKMGVKWKIRNLNIKHNFFPSQRESIIGKSVVYDTVCLLKGVLGRSAV